jgi:hypothetical protein
VTALLLVVGVALIGLAVFDVLTTTVSLGSGAGPVTRAVSRGSWSAARRLTRDHTALRRVGVAILLASIALWLLLIWSGWTLVFTALDSAVVDATTGAPATFGQRVYFAGYTILTLGNGDYRPAGDLWRLVTVLAVANGFAVLTLAITYLVPVVSAATEKRRLAAHLDALGSSPHGLLLGAWDGADFEALGRDLGGLGPQLLLHEQRHHTYPVLHYFHSGEPATAAPLRLAALDEALTIAEHGLAEQVRPHDRRLDVLRQAVTSYLGTTAQYLSTGEERPPPTSVQPLRDAGIPTVDDDTYTAAVGTLDDRRRQLLALLRHDAWEWADLAPDGSLGGRGRGRPGG